MERKKQMKQLKEKGLSYGSIGKLFDISRQRVHQLISGYVNTDKRKRNKNKELNKLFESVFERDNNECQICEGKDTLIIHHIDKNWRNNISNNLVCLCNICHLNLHRPNMKKENNPRWKGGITQNMKVYMRKYNQENQNGFKKEEK